MSNENLPKPAESSAEEASGDGLSVADPPSQVVLEPEVLQHVERIARHAVSVVMKHEHHSGPMPAPKTFKAYDEVLPGTAQVIRDEFQFNGKHVRAMEDKALSGQISNDAQNRRTAERLVWGAFLLILTLAWMGQATIAVAVAVTTVAAVITGFISGKVSAGKSGGDPKSDS